MAGKSFIFRFGDVEVREREFSIAKAGEVLAVEPKAFRVLLHLLRNPRKLIPKEELLNAVWGETAVSENSLTRSIALLRKLLGDEARDPWYIETVATVGYRFVCAVKVSEDGVGDLQATGETKGFHGEVLVATPANGEITEATTNPAAQIGTGAGNKGRNGRVTGGRRNRFKRWLLPGGAIFAVGIAVATWYLRRPQPPLRVTEYTQITHDGRAKDLAGTDGARLYFNRVNSPQPTDQVATSGGEIAQVPVALPLPEIMDVSPYGSALLVVSADKGQGSLWSVQIPGGSLRRLLTDVWVNSAAWSPDGKSVVYSTGNGDLYFIRSDGTGVRKLADVGGSTDTLSWSSDGSRIRFFKNSRPWEMSSDGSRLHPLLPDWRPSLPLCCGRWTPDGKFFVFLSRGDSLSSYYSLPHANQLWVLDERRGWLMGAPTEPVQLTSGPIRWNTPIPSKDGTKIFAEGVILRGELVRFDAQSHRLQPWLGGISAEFVTFSPDGKSVAYVTFPEGVMWRANRDGSNPVQLTDPPMYPLNPRWSPDGTQILFFQDDSAGHLRSYIVPSQGGAPRLLLPEEKEGTGDANWSPDGRKIVFSSLSAEIFTSNALIRIVDLDSHQITTLPGSDGVWSPRWSPNGRFIAGIYSSSSGGLKVFDFETQQWSLLRLKGEIDWPMWSSNSQFIYFLRPRDDPGVFRVRVSDGAEERVVDLKGFRFTGSLTMWTGLDPQDAPLLIRDVGTDDIYALTLEEK